jgi:PncC family amidohydrolase
MSGGLVAARFTEAPGATEFFRGSVVSYATEVKALVLGVDESILSTDGPVSERCALGMARGARERLAAHVGVSVTGEAGPVPQDAAVGTGFIAGDGPLGSHVRMLQLPGNREAIRAIAVGAVLNLARLYLLERLE